VSKNAGGGPIWARPEPGSRRPRFTREQIAAVALGIADTEGFEAVSMRRVATDLGAGTMTLYNYVRTKDDLVSLMHDALMAEVIVPEDELPIGWRAALTVIARRTRAALVRHPWASASLQEAQFGPNAMRRFEQFLAAVAATGLDPAAKFDLLTVVNSYVFGNALITGESRKRADAAQADPASVGPAIEFGLAQLRTGQFPHTAALFADADPSAQAVESVGPPMDEQGLADQFERGLQALLDGVAIRMGLPEAEMEMESVMEAVAET
jgi:AcrR family transcriptional regulator